MRRTRLFFVFCLIWIGSAGTAVYAQAPELMPWSSSQALVKELGMAVAVGDYSIQPPVGYTPTKLEGAPAGTEMSAWAGAVRQDGTRAMLMISVADVSAAQPSEQDLDKFLSAVLGSLKKLRLDWKQTKTDSGRMNGFAYLRVGWSGAHAESKAKMQGWVVVMRDGDKFIAIASQDIVPYAEQTLPLAQAAASTFKRNKLLLSGARAIDAHQMPALPQWTPSPALLKQLDPTVSVEGFLLQPPAEYKLLVPDSGLPAGVSSYIWVGPGRKDGTHSVLMLNFLIPANDQMQNLTLNQLADGLLLEIKEARRDWTQTPAETGTIQGMKFVRIGWTGIDRVEKRKMWGWMMVAHEGDTIIQLVSQEVSPKALASLDLAEAAARTLKRLDTRVIFDVDWPGHGQIFAMNQDGSKRVCLTPNSDTDYRPALSPDGTTIAFTTHRDGMRALYFMNPDGSDPRRITRNEDAGLCSWSPDGTQLAFSSNRDGRYCIYVMNRDGSNVRKVSQGPSDDSPDWSPDGRQIVYEGSEGQIRQIVIVNADGAGAKALTKGKTSARFPRWSPGGDQIVYSAGASGKDQIYMMRPDGTSVTRVTNDMAEDRQPSFTADGRQILFHSNRAGKFELYALDLATHKDRRIATEEKDTGGAITLGRSQPAPPAKEK